MSSTPQSFNFEAALKELELLVSKMDNGQLTLEEALKNFEQGIALAKQCQKTLKEAEQSIQVLIEQNNTLQSVPFTNEDK